MSGGRRKGPRNLSGEERELWTRVASTATPLKTTAWPPPDLVLPPPTEPPASPAAAAPPPQTETAMRPAPAPKGPPPLAPIERRVRQKVVRGQRRIDARIDLHGLTQHQAHDRLRGFLRLAQQQGHTFVLVITGKGGSGAMAAYMDERGILRRVVPQWLAMADLRGIVLGFEEAHLTHGGAGALYVRLRKLKDS
ncbi:DNA mismatch repair protein MutS [Microvirga tunisiensis]|uniref:DNA mismatch repair protein MutS n=1 Tax=Pannonibacter tanglangensis TaxID=2750084 RepID=A0A7X5F7Z0_9HYPH|nr:DNA mismatch repair protein MutS [Pannonibacter sp. XCT-53]